MAHKPIYGWHFVGATLRNNVPIPENGKWLKYTGKIKICSSGFHFSDTPWQALQYAPGSILCYVEVKNIIQRHSDKGVCACRKIIDRLDVTDICSYFARQQAISVLRFWHTPPVQVILDWLLTGNKTIRLAAQSAAELALQIHVNTNTHQQWLAAQSAIQSTIKSTAQSTIYAAKQAAIWSAPNSTIEPAFNELIYSYFQGAH